MSKDLLIVKCDTVPSPKHHAELSDTIKAAVRPMGFDAILLKPGTDAEVDRNYGPRMDAILEEQRRTNALLSMLIEALAEDQGVEDMEPATYMDGTPR